MSNEQAVVTIVTDAGRNRFVIAVFAAVLISTALYFGRVVFEPVAFVLFAMALVEPFQKAAKVRLGKPVALILTILLTLLVLSILVFAIVWSIGDVVHWGLANVERFQSLYMRARQWLEGHDLFIMDLSGLNSSSFAGVFQTVAMQVNYLIGFALVVFLYLVFGLAELDDFKIKLAALDKTMSGWSLVGNKRADRRENPEIYAHSHPGECRDGLGGLSLHACDRARARRRMGHLSFVLNYIPYIGPLVAVILPVIFATAQFESWQMAAIIFGSLYLIQFVIGNYLEPMLTGNALAISPFVMLFAFLIWDFLWGMPGAFIGLPVTIALFTIWEQNPSTRWIANLMSTSAAASDTQLAKTS